MFNDEVVAFCFLRASLFLKQNSKIGVNAWHAHEARALNPAWLAQRDRANPALLGEQVGGGAGDAE
jgi:hypothetical protein